MSYDYGVRTVYLGTLAQERHPAIYDLCARHAQHLSLPRGWTVRLDRLAAVERRAG